MEKFQRIRQGFFGVLFVMSKNASHNKNVYIVMLLLSMHQVRGGVLGRGSSSRQGVCRCFGFQTPSRDRQPAASLARSRSLPASLMQYKGAIVAHAVSQLILVPLTKVTKYLSWANDPYIAWFSEVLAWVTFQKPVFAFLTAPAFQFAVWLLALMWAVGVVLCAVWVGRSFFNENFTIFWPIKVCGEVSVDSPATCSRHPQPRGKLACNAGLAMMQCAVPDSACVVAVGCRACAAVGPTPQPAGV